MGALPSRCASHKESPYWVKSATANWSAYMIALSSRGALSDSALAPREQNRALSKAPPGAEGARAGGPTVNRRAQRSVKDGALAPPEACPRRTASATERSCASGEVERSRGGVHFALWFFLFCP